jgi:hypothetical protein
MVMTGPTTTTGPSEVVVHGAVTVLVTSADARVLGTVERQLGPLLPRVDAAGGANNVDLEVRFVPEIRTRGTLVFAGHGEAAYDDDSFYVTRTKGQTPTLVRMPLDRAGEGRCVIECEHGVPAVPLLVALVNIAALAHGVLPLHASAVHVAGRTLLMTGWSKGGKTESVLALQQRGASYVSDEWSYLTRDETGAMQVSGLPEPVRLWAWQFRQLPELAQRLLGRRQRARLTALDRGGAWLGRAGHRNGRFSSLSRRLAPVVARQAYEQVPPDRLFSGRRIKGPVRVDELVLVQGWGRDEVVLQPIPGDEIAARMAHSLVYERLPLTMAYEQFRFAFPTRASSTIEQAEQIERRLLSELFDGREAHRLVHPYPPDLEQIALGLQPLLQTQR